MKKKGFRGILLLVFSFILTSCRGGLLDAIFDIYGDQSRIEYPVENESGAFYRPNSYVYDNQELHYTQDQHTVMKSTGRQKMLVVPVVFSDYRHEATAANKDVIERVFFGHERETGWESVSSFYKKSSYGKLSLTGQVADYFYVNMTTTELKAKETNGSYWNLSHYVLEEIYNTYSASFLKQFDQDGDGYVDGAWFVYMNPYDVTTDIFWAFKSMWNYYPNVDKPRFDTYAWASFDFAHEAEGYSKTKPDAHTYIHETGHMMGLVDYYDYDAETSPLGGLDMMDMNIGDHNMYSKYVLNWNQPYVPTGPAVINLKPSHINGDFILLNKNWNGHAYDEYLLIDYYVPKGLNAQDSSGDGYHGANNFSIPGVRIYHVDSRLVKITNGMMSLTNEIVDGADTYTTIGANNTESRNRFGNPNYKHIHLLNASLDRFDWYYYNLYADNSALFQSGMRIEASHWKLFTFGYRYSFNSGRYIEFEVEIGRMTDESVTIYIDEW